MSGVKRHLWRLLERIPVIIAEEIVAHLMMIIIALLLAIALIMLVLSAS